MTAKISDAAGTPRIGVTIGDMRDVRELQILALIAAAARSLAG